MKSLSLFFILIYVSNSFSQKIKVPVFESGKEGYSIYRIPAIIRIPNGNLLAFCEGRVNNASDFGDINIVMKRSVDNGKFWDPIQTVVDNATLQAGNPAPVVDLTDPQYPNGRIFLFYNTGNNHENEVRKGNGLREVWYITSTDSGKSWSDPENITLQTHRPKQPGVNKLYDFPEDWRSYANTPGHAMQFTSGKYKGRIYIAANHSSGDPQDSFKDYNAHGFYSDDHGKTFHISENVSIQGSNESMAVELADDQLVMNTRNQQGDIRERIISISSDGGSNWDTTYFDSQLPDPVCQGSMITINKSNNIIAFCNAADKVRRNGLTLRISEDGGKTWAKSWIIDKDFSETKGDYTAYSDLVVLDEKDIGILYERNNYKEIVFITHTWN
jgi:sialidase-1